MREGTEESVSEQCPSVTEARVLGPAPDSAGADFEPRPASRRHAVVSAGRSTADPEPVSARMGRGCPTLYVPMIETVRVSISEGEVDP